MHTCRTPERRNRTPACLHAPGVEVPSEHQPESPRPSCYIWAPYPSNVRCQQNIIKYYKNMYQVCQPWRCKQNIARRSMVCGPSVENPRMPIIMMMMMIIIIVTMITIVISIVVIIIIIIITIIITILTLLL